MGEKRIVKENDISLILGAIYEPRSFLEQLKEILTLKYIIFLFRPGAKDEQMEHRYKELDKYKTKRNFMQRLKTPFTILGISIIFIISTLAVFPEWISFTFFRDLAGHLGAFKPPSFEHPLGTGEWDKDLWKGLIWGARPALKMGVYSVAISITGGVILGTIAAYKAGWMDKLIMRSCDVVDSIPRLFLAILVVSVFGNDVKNIIWSWGLLGIARYAKLIRSSVVSILAMPYIQSAKVSGALDLDILFYHILPNIVVPITIAASFDFGVRILGLSGLAFLGFGPGIHVLKTFLRMS